MKPSLSSRAGGICVIVGIAVGYVVLSLVCAPIAALGWLLGYHAPLHR